jgi:hypothetical protein
VRCFNSVSLTCYRSSVKSRLTPHIIKFAEWPTWVRALVVTPHVLLGMLATLLWWPKTPKERSRFWLVAVYLLTFFLVMRYIFGA